MDVVIQPNASAAANFVATLIADEVREQPQPVLGLATGRTMELVYAELARRHTGDRIDFSACHTFNLDEYVGLSATDANSYRHYMTQHLFSAVNIRLENTHIPNGVADDLDAECERYEQKIKGVGGVGLQLLGIGRSGHIGFNEPLSAINSRTRVVVLAPATLRQNAKYFGDIRRMPRLAITMGVGTILESRRCILLATGAEKTTIVQKAVEGPLTGLIPASALQTHRNCVVVLDEVAAGKLNHAEYYRWVFANDSKWEAFRNARGPGKAIATSARSLPRLATMRKVRDKRLVL